MELEGSFLCPARGRHWTFLKPYKAKSNPRTSFTNAHFLQCKFLSTQFSKATVPLGFKGKGKGKGIVHSRTGHEGPKGE